MGKRHDKGGGERFIRLHHWMLKSPAWLALSPNAKAVLLHVWERHNGSNNGQIVYGVREAEKVGLSIPAAARALAELVELGFMRVTRSSSFDLKTKEARVWALTAEPIDDRPATREFMRWVGPKSKPPLHLKGHSAKSKTQYPQGNTQYPQGNRDRENGVKNGLTVPPGEPSEAKVTRSQFPQGNTSNLPYGAAVPAEPGIPSSADRNANRRPLKFGDAAKAERTLRPPRVLH
jgi:hypothetical protein